VIRIADDPSAARLFMRVYGPLVQMVWCDCLFEQQQEKQPLGMADMYTLVFLPLCFDCARQQCFKTLFHPFYVFLIKYGRHLSCKVS